MSGGEGRAFPCRPIETAPAEGKFLAENMHGDWMVVQRFDPGKRLDFSANAVISGRTGRWWYARLWMPLLTARDEFPETLADANPKDLTP